MGILKECRVLGSPSQARDELEAKRVLKKISLTREMYDKANPCIL